MGNETFYWDGLSVRLSSYGCTQEIAKDEISLIVARGDSRKQL